MKHTDRCPWCGKIMNKKLDDRDFTVRHSFGTANCHHCYKKYGQVPTFPHMLINIVIFLAGILPCGFISDKLFGNPIVLVVVEFAVFLYLCHKFTPYARFNDRKREVEVNPDLVCDVYFLETYDKIQCNRLYFFENDFDCFEPFMVASPICFYNVEKKKNYAWCELLYMHEKNYKYIGKESCDLYDSNMKLVAKVKIILDSPDIQGEQNSEKMSCM